MTIFFRRDVTYIAQTCSPVAELHCNELYVQRKGQTNDTSISMGFALDLCIS